MNKNEMIPFEKNKIEKILSKIKDSIPTLPTMVTQLLNLILDGRSSVRDISRIVKIDQTLTSKVLKVVNSADYGLRGKISTVDQAVTIIGFDALKSIFLSLSIFDNLLGNGADQIMLFDKSHFWCHSLAVATVSRNLAQLIKYKSPDEAYIAGLLHDIGKIIIEQILPDEYHNYLKNLTLNPSELSLQFEEENILLNHASIGKLIFEKWNLPLCLQEAVGMHHGLDNAKADIPNLAAIVSVADFICWTQGLGSFSLFTQPMLNHQMEKIINLKEMNLEPVLEVMKKELELNAKIFNFKLANPEDLRKALQKANLELGRINSLWEEIKKKQERQIHDLSVLNSIISKNRKVLEPIQIIQDALPEIHKGFGFARLIWFLVDSKKEMLTPRGSLGEFKSNLTLSSIGCNWNDEIGSTLYKCIQSKKILHIKEGNGTGNNDYLHLLKTLSSQELLLVPLSTEDTITDLLLLDNPDGDIFISDNTIQLIDILAINLGMALENAKLFQHTNQIAIYDFLTNIYNRRHLDFSLNNEVNRSTRFQQPFCIAMLDLDHFKLVNDIYGHQAGDIVLKDVATIIKMNTRNIDIVGRLGGDEFMVILLNTRLQNAFVFAERIRQIIEKYGLHRQKDFPKCQITVSIGLAEFDYIHDTADRLLSKADKALYQAKEKGKNMVSGWHSAAKEKG